MIPVAAQPEPGSFNALVRQPGLQFLSANGIPPGVSLPKGKKLPPHWRKQLAELHAAYKGICAYIGVYIEISTGGASVDHFVAKSGALCDAYEWNNYRLACTNINSKKGSIPNLLDPFNVQSGWFVLDLLTGAIGVGEGLTRSQKSAVARVIKRLDLDRAAFRGLRATWYTDYISRRISYMYFQERAPFVFHEAARQGLL